MSIKLFTLPQVTVTTAGTRVQISSTDTAVTTVLIQADPSNTGRIYVGDSNVASNRAAAVLEADASFSITADASGRSGWEEYILSDFYLDSSANGDKAYISYVKRR